MERSNLSIEPMENSISNFINSTNRSSASKVSDDVADASLPPATCSSGGRRACGNGAALSPIECLGKWVLQAFLTGRFCCVSTSTPPSPCSRPSYFGGGAKVEWIHPPSRLLSLIIYGTVKSRLFGVHDPNVMWSYGVGRIWMELWATTGIAWWFHIRPTHPAGDSVTESYWSTDCCPNMQQEPQIVQHVSQSTSNNALHRCLNIYL